MGNECYKNHNHKIYNTYNTYISIIGYMSNMSTKHNICKEKTNKKRVILRNNYIINDLLSPLNYNNYNNYNKENTKSLLSPILSPIQNSDISDISMNSIYTSPFIMKAGSAYNSPINNISSIIRIENYVDTINTKDIDEILSYNDNDNDFVLYEDIQDL